MIPTSDLEDSWGVKGDLEEMLLGVRGDGPPDAAEIRVLRLVERVRPGGSPGMFGAWIEVRGVVLLEEVVECEVGGRGPVLPPVDGRGKTL